MAKQKSKILGMARQGNARAIAAVLNHWLQPKGITTTASRENAGLQLRLEAERVPNQKVLVVFVRKVFASLGISSIETVQVSLYLTGKNYPVWQAELEIMPQLIESTGEMASETMQAEIAAPTPQEAIEPEVTQLPSQTFSEGLPPVAVADAAEQGIDSVPVPSALLDEETVTQPEASTSDLAAIPSISSQERDGEETAAGAPEQVTELAAIPSELSEEPAAVGKRSQEESAADIPAPERNAPASWLDTKMGKLLVLLPIYLLALAILGIDYLQERSTPAPAEPTPTVSPAAGRK